MSLLATAAGTAIAAASAAIALASFFAYLYFARRSEVHAAREEALALAETRGHVIVDLRGRLDQVEQRLRDTTAAYEARIYNLEQSLERAELEAREQAYRMHRFYATSLADLLRDVQTELTREPPDVAGALRRIGELLDGERPAA
jgi:hypothetical protein